ncbi:MULTISPECIES: head-tail connector protein [Clostridium]|jgi:hypothetical protein|uniref:Phage gp6-like head-tail connector protein n=1 Tax=Clostridium aromativorans TaxID=2836848 RepID=A0ABS8N3L0_9CLOT|nr:MULTISPECIES: head-tail connector protein [Clostridium]MCC9294372.1 phage gp6-like head-tail connector protein [Clostridium aromativorans]MCI1945582.1 phage gp6-like head-tail connector protein [Clostridium luticellarii]
MNILTMDEAHNILRVDGNELDIEIQALIDAIPPYLEATTGRTWTDDDTIHPMAKTAAQFILMLWFDPMDRDIDKLRKAIDSLLTALEAVGRSMNNG